MYWVDVRSIRLHRPGDIGASICFLDPAKTKGRPRGCFDLFASQTLQHPSRVVVGLIQYLASLPPPQARHRRDRLEREYRRTIAHPLRRGEADVRAARPYEADTLETARHRLEAPVELENGLQVSVARHDAVAAGDVRLHSGRSRRTTLLGNTDDTRLLRTFFR